MIDEQKNMVSSVKQPVKFKKQNLGPVYLMNKIGGKTSEQNICFLT